MDPICWAWQFEPYPDEITQVLAVKADPAGDPLLDLSGAYYAAGCSHGAQQVLRWAVENDAVPENDQPQRIFVQSTGLGEHDDCVYHTQWCGVKQELYDEVHFSLDWGDTCQLQPFFPHQDSHPCVAAYFQGLQVRLDLLNQNHALVENREIGRSWGVNTNTAVDPVCDPNTNPTEILCSEEGGLASTDGGRQFRAKWRGLEDGGRSQEEKMAQKIAVGFAALAPLLTAVPTISDHIPVRNESAKLLASDGQAQAWFGHAVAIDGDTIGVGAPGGNEPDDRPAYIFQRTVEGLWAEEARLTYSDPPERRGFGQSVALDGARFVVGAWTDGDLGQSAGAAYVFERGADGVWREAVKLHAPDGEAGDAFGESVSIDGDWLVVGTEFRDDLGEWSGAAYVFQREGTDWPARAKLLAPDGKASDFFGESVAIHGSTVVVGARGDDDRGLGAGSVYIFERGEDGSWVAMGKLFAPDAESGDIFGADVAIDGDVLVVSANGDDDQGSLSGSAYVFEREQDGSWVARAKLLSPHGRAVDDFGFVGVSGETVVVGAEGGQSQPGLPSGTVDVFRRNEEGEWVNVVRLLASDPGFLDQLGISVAIDGTTVVAGARLDDDQGDDSGSAYVFTLEGCLLRLRLDSQAVRPGEELRVGVSLEHHRPETVTVPLRLWVENASGDEIASRTTPPLTFRHGETLRRELAVRIPEGTPPGRYRVLAGLEQMQQGRARAARWFRVVHAPVVPPGP